MEAFDFGEPDEANDVAPAEPELQPTYLKSKRGGDRVTYNGYLYGSPKSLSDDQTVAWRCVYKLHCNARLHTVGLNGAVVNEYGEHPHLGDPIKVQAEKLKANVKRRASDTVETPQQILGNSLADVPQVVQEGGPSKDALRQLVYRERKRVLDVPAVPENRADIELPEQFCFYQCGEVREAFLLADTGMGDENRILVFGRESVRESIGTIELFYVDGTFSITPPLFGQVFTIVGRQGNFVQPVFHALLPDKRSLTYQRLFELLMQTFPDFNPRAFCCDFEVGLIAAIRRLWPDVHLYGCWFHLCQILYRHVVGELRQLYNTDGAFAIQVRMVGALAFVPVARVPEYYEALILQVDQRLLPYCQYFEENYIGRKREVGRGRNQRFVRDDPRFAISMWNLYVRTLNNVDKTNNFAEAAHRRTKDQICVHHPGLWRFLRALQDVQRVLDYDYFQHRGGHRVPQLAAVATRAKRLRTIVEEFETHEPVDFLRTVAHNISLGD